MIIDENKGKINMGTMVGLAKEAKTAGNLLRQLSDENSKILEEVKKDTKRLDTLNKNYEKRRNAQYTKKLKQLEADDKLDQARLELEKSKLEEDLQNFKDAVDLKKKGLKEKEELYKKNNRIEYERIQLREEEKKSAKELLQTAKDHNIKQQAIRENYYQEWGSVIGTMSRGADAFWDKVDASGSVVEKFNNKVLKGVEGILAVTMGSKKAATFSAKAKEKSLEAKGFAKDKGKELKDAAVKPVGTVLDMLKGVMMGAFMFVAIKKIVEFMNSDTFKKIVETIEGVLMPALKWIWDTFGIMAFLIPTIAVLLGSKIVTGIKIMIVVAKLFGKVMGFLIPNKFKAYLTEVITNMKGWMGKKWQKVRVSVKLFKRFMLREFIPNMISSLKDVMRNIGNSKFMKPFRWLIKVARGFKVFMMSTFLPTMLSGFTGMISSLVGVLSGFMATLTPILVAAAPFVLIGVAIAAVLYGLYESFKKAKETFQKTGSITESIKTFFIHFATTPYRWIKNLVAWVMEKFGFGETAKKLKDFDITQWISDTISGLWDTIRGWFGYGPKAVKGGKGFFERIGDMLSDFFGGIFHAVLTKIGELLPAKWGGDDILKFAEGFKPKKRETGGSVAAGELVMVGERGPEMMVTGQPGTVHTAQRTESMLNDALNKNAQPHQIAGSTPIINNIVTDNSTQSSTGFISPVEMIINDKLFRAAHSYTC